MNIGSIAAGLEQGKAPGVLVRQERAAGEPVAIAGDPVAMAVVTNVEMVRQANARRGAKSVILANRVCFTRCGYKIPCP